MPNHARRPLWLYDLIVIVVALLALLAWDFSGGYAWHEGKTTLSYMRRAPTAENVYRAEYDFGPKWRLRYEYWSGSNVKEYAVRYRIHEFLSGEYVYSTDKSYFRIVGNL